MLRSSHVMLNSRLASQVISISQRYLPWEVQKGSKDYFPGGQAGFDAYMGVGLNAIHFGEDVRAAENMEFIANGSLNNALCFVGPHRVYSPWSATYQDLVPGQGHFGPDALPGVRSIVTHACTRRFLSPCFCCGRMPAGVAVRPCRPRRRAPPWWASRPPPTRCSSTATAVRIKCAVAQNACYRGSEPVG